MAKITKFYPKHSADNPDNVLERAIGAYNDVLIIGWDKEDNIDCRSSTNLTRDQILWLVTKFQHKLMNGDFSGD